VLVRSTRRIAVAPAPAEILMKEFGFTVENIVKKIKEMM
jgi:transketolase